MKKDKSPPQADKPSAPATPDSEIDSLDFSHIGPAKSPAPPSGADGKASGARPVAGRSTSRKGPRAPTGSAVQVKRAGPRRLVLRIVIIVTIGLVIAFAMSQRSSDEAVTPQPSDVPAPPAHQTLPKPPQTSAPSTKVPTPPQPPTPAPPTLQNVPAPAIPAEFVRAFKEYAARSGSKAIALALDSNGRFAYGSIAGYSTQAEASEEALSECTRFRAQAGIQENCRLYAAGDKVVW